MKKIIILLTLITPCYLFGQLTDAGGHFSSEAPSINAASTAQGGHRAGIDYNTGAATAYIPLFNKSISGVNLNISLNYFSRGTKASDIGSWVGLGWNLQAGGVITRTVRGKADDTDTPQSVGYFNTRSDNQTNVNLSNNTPHSFFENNHINDISPDIFHFNFLGRTGRLVFVGEPTTEYPIYGEIITVPYQDLKVKVTANNSSLNITEFTITDEHGVQYIFGQSQVSGNNDVEMVNSGGATYMESWYLNEIKLPNGEVIFSFDYENILYADYGSSPNSHQMPLIIVPSYTANNVGSQSTNWVAPCPTGTPAHQLPQQTYDRYNQLYLKEIHFEGGSYLFETVDRVDVDERFPATTPLKALEKIHYKGLNGEILSTYYFQHHYFKNGPGYPSRLALNTLTQFGKEDINFTNPTPILNHPEFDNRPSGGDFQFNYYTQTIASSSEWVPNPLTVHVDAWGYINNLAEENATNQLDYVLELTPDFNYIDRNGTTQTHILTGYPLYSTTTRVPSNDVSIVQIGMLSSIKFPDNTIVDYTYELNEAYEKDFFDNINLTTSSEANRICGGVRVEHITERQETTQSAYASLSQKWYKYETVDANGDLTGQSSGVVFNKSPLINRYKKTARAGDNNGTLPNDLCFVCDYEIIIPNIIDPLTESYDNHMVYNTVSEIITSEQQNIGGKNIYYFDTYQQYPEFYQEPIEYLDQASQLARSQPLVLEQKVAPHVAQFNYISTPLIKKEVYKYEVVGGNPVYSIESREEYTYKTVIDNQESIDLLDAKRQYLTYASYEIPCREYNHLTGISSVDNYDYPNLYDKKLVTINPKISRLLEYENQTIYDDAGLPITSEKKYTYDGYNQLVEERKSSSDDTYYFIKYFRVTDFGTPPLQAHLDMLSKHIHIPIIEEVKYFNNAAIFNGNEKILSGRYRVFDNFSGNILSKTNLRLNTASPLPPSSVDVFSDVGFDAQFYKPVNQSLAYDVKGRLLSAKVENGVESYNKYSDSPTKILIAQAQYGTEDNVYYTSFENEETGLSNDFAPLDVSIPLDTDGRTGDFSVNLTLSGVKQTNVSTGKYILSFWTKGIPNITQTVDVTGTSITILKQHVSIITPNEWKINHYVVDVTALSDILITGSQLIDEIRMYPYDAQMKTYTYYNGGGVRSITNENDVTTFYNYDLMHRLKEVKDANQNLLEERKYHTINLNDSNY